MLIAADPAGAPAYTANAAAYRQRGCARSTRAIAACMRSIPAARRRLVTDHDALGYYADRYGDRGRRHRDPGAVDAGAGLGRRGRAPRAHDPLARACGRSSPSARRARSSRARSPATRARRSAPRCTPTRSARRGSPGATYLGSLRFNTRALAAGFGAARGRALSAVGVPGLQERQRIDRRAAGVPARARSTARSAGGSRCASPVSPTLPIGWPVSTRAPFASGDGLAQVHVDVVDVGALAVDDDVVAGRALGAVELHDAAARGDQRRAAAREDVVALVRVAVALRRRTPPARSRRCGARARGRCGRRGRSRRSPAPRAPGRRRRRRRRRRPSKTRNS